MSQKDNWQPEKIELDHTTIDAISKLKKKNSVFKVRITKQTKTITVIEGLGDSQRDGEYTVGTIYMIDGVTYIRPTDCDEDDY